MSPAELVDQLASAEAWIRHEAKQLLYRRPSEAVVAAADARLAELLAGKERRATRPAQNIWAPRPTPKRRPNISCTS